MTTARAYSNIAFIKYWGNRDAERRLPVNGSLSMNLEGVETVTTVDFVEGLPADELTINGQRVSGPALERVSKHLDHLRERAGVTRAARVESANSFPMGAGIASSASAFAALSVAGAAALGLELSERELSRVARLGSGSASRSVPGGFVEWYVGDDDESSYAESIAPPEHWALVDLVAVVSTAHKAVGSTGGHALAPTSALQGARVADAERRLNACREAILAKRFDDFAAVVEEDALMMHAVMMTSQPPLIYWEPATLQLISAVQLWRSEGLGVCFTIDAGPNVHVITLAEDADETHKRLSAMDSVSEVLRAKPGGAAHVLPQT
jgi:diphosphomevalonate decarboxylase